MDKSIIMGQRLRELREASGLSQSQVAEIIGKTLKTYQRYERDETLPLIDTALLLAEYYNVSVKYLAGKTNDPNDFTP